MGSTASRLEPLQAGSLLFTTKFPEIPGTHFIDLGRMKDRVDHGATLDWESSALTTRPLLHFDFPWLAVKYRLDIWYDRFASEDIALIDLNC